MPELAPIVSLQNAYRWAILVPYQMLCRLQPPGMLCGGLLPLPESRLTVRSVLAACCAEPSTLPWQSAAMRREWACWLTAPWPWGFSR